MTCTRIPEGWKLEFLAPEAQILTHSLEELVAHYEIRVDDLPPGLKHFWKGQISADQGDLAHLQGEAEWLAEERNLWRGERLQAAEIWLEELHQQIQHPQATLLLVDEQIDSFLCAINDRRLLLGTENGVGPEDMEAKIEEIADDKRRWVIGEIDLLGYFQVVCLEALEGTL